MSPNESSATPLLVLRKITSILDAFSLAQPELSLAEIRAATGVPHSTVQRLVANMVQEGILDRHGDRFRVGVRMAHWAAPATQGLDFLELLTPVLRRLRDELGETACVFRESQGKRVCIALAETRRMLRRVVQVGEIMPLHVGAAGRVLLAWNPDVADQVYRSGLRSLTDQTITDAANLEAAVARTKADGFAITTGERVSGASGISAPIFGPQAELYGALTVMGPAMRMPYDVCASWVEPVLAAAEESTRVIGGTIPQEGLSTSWI
ncbi:Transcriptional repressor IclR [Arthrobacter sp. Bi83]|jgi:DNA-binding IclR family transcriptional regulator|uniref:IclR family transcriptional regulator n=1 Tax=Arthrobacter sp. Bi83 TaxID=2822353 RepID=UPI001D579137|nr:IclR family transcriptional regulator [Arthrobacter sp. Bi83]CAH0250582.1 Transcriptional repressor IclR [Arthrobacter sp. Bi83]